MLSILLKDTQQMRELRAEPQQPPEPTFLWHAAAILAVPLSTHAPQNTARLEGLVQGSPARPAPPIVLLFANPVSRRRQWHPTPVLLPGKSHGRRGLVGCSPWGREESDTTERLHFHFSLSCIGEGNGNPLQCSCLENPRDGETGGLPSMGSHRVGYD